MAKTWRFQNVDSDLDISGQAYGDIMADTGSGTRSQTATNGGGTTIGYYISPSGTSLVGQSNTGSWTVVLNVSAAASSTEAEVYLRRYNSSGVQQTTVTMATSPTSTGSTGDKTFTASNPSLGTWASGDRLVVAVLVRNNNAHGGAAGPTWDLGATNTRVDTPFTFASPQTITDPALLGGAQLFSPTVAPGPVLITDPALLGGAQLFAPTLVASQIVGAMDLLGGAQLFDPSFVQQQIVTPDLLGGAQLFSPTIAPGAVAVEPALLGGAQLFTPAFERTVAPGLLGGAQLFAPKVHRAYAGKVMSLGPLYYWRLGEPSGTTATDEAGNLNASYVASPTLGATGALVGDSNTAVTLNGTSQRVLPGDVTVFDSNTSWTFGAWVNHTPDGGFRRIFSKEYWPAARHGVLIYSQNTAIGIERYENSNQIFATGSALSAGWHFVVGTYDGSKVRLYVDGSLVATSSGSNSTAIADNSESFSIGAYSAGGDWFNGSIDEVFVFASALNGTQISDLYQIGRGLQNVSPDVLGGAQLYTPTVVPGEVTVTPALLGGAQLFSPQVDQAVDLALLGGAQLFSPQVNQSIDVAQLGGAQLFTPTLFQEQFVTPGLLGGGQLYEPEVTIGAVSVQPDLLGGAQLFEPTIAVAGTTVEPDLLGGGQLFSPTVVPGPVSVEPDLLGGAQVFSPTVLPGAVVITPGLLGGAQLFAPSLVQQQFITPDLLGGLQLFAPKVSIGQSEIGPMNLLGSAQLFDPTVTLVIAGGTPPLATAGHSLARNRSETTSPAGRATHDKPR